jgi:RNA polymerase sigma-70 factor (ECF subfamily)
VAENHEYIKKAQAGSVDAYAALFVKYSRVFFRKCCKITGNETDAHDLLMQTYLIGIYRIKEFKEESSFFTWLIGIARNLWPRLEKKLKITRCIDQSIDDLSDILPDPQETPEELYWKKKNYEIARSIIDKMLSDTEKIVLDYRIIQGLSSKDTALILGKTINSVNTTLCQALKKVREKVKKTF